VFVWSCRSLPSAYAQPDNRTARTNMHNASCLGGMAFANSFLGITHSCAHPLGSLFSIPHGLAIAQMLPHVIAFNSQEAPFHQTAFPQYKYFHATEQYAEIFDYVGLETTNGLRSAKTKAWLLIEAIENLKRQVDISQGLKHVILDKEQFTAAIPQLSEMAFDDQCTGTNPRYPLITELSELFRNAYAGPPLLT
jgi:acetaldehyde dehydrogenase/alcohol dehydrogenase